MTSLLNKTAVAYHNGEQFVEGKIVFVSDNTIWIIKNDGFIMRCSPNSVKVIGD